MNGFEHQIEELETRISALEERAKEGASVGVLYSRLQRQLEELALHVEYLTDILIQVLPVLQRLDPSFDARPLLESCNELKKKREPADEMDEYFG
jgi:septation ring formation regulator EzrA